MARAEREPLEFAGPPSRITTQAALPPLPKTRAVIEFDGTTHPVVVEGSREQPTRLTFNVPITTPPGKRTAKVMLGEDSVAANVDIQACCTVHIKPRTVELTAVAGQTARASVQVINVGNAAIDMSASDIIEVRPAGALARAVKGAFATPNKDFAGRLVDIGERLSSESSHVLKVTAKMPVDTLATNAQATVELAISVPDALQPDIVYRGRYQMLGTTVKIELSVRENVVK